MSFLYLHMQVTLTYLLIWHMYYSIFTWVLCIYLSEEISGYAYLWK